MMKPITSAISSDSSPCERIPGRDSTVYDCALLQLPRIENRAGSITVLESPLSCPFEIHRVYFLYDVPGGTSRGGHAHRKLEQLLVAASGSFEVLLDDGRNRRTIFLNRPYYGLQLPAGIWRELHNFSSGSICLALASEKFDESDYIREHVSYLDWKLK